MLTLGAETLENILDDLMFCRDRCRGFRLGGRGLLVSCWTPQGWRGPSKGWAWDLTLSLLPWGPGVARESLWLGLRLRSS